MPVIIMIRLSGPRTTDNRILLSYRSALAAESGAASVSCGVSEWVLVWVLASDSHLQWLLGSMLAC